MPPPQGAASSDELTTNLGQARGLSSSLAPTSTRWQRVFVLDDKRAILAGEFETEAVALVTDTAGRTWRSFRHRRDGWSTWALGPDGAIVLAVGPRAELPPSDAARRRAGEAPLPPTEPIQLLFAPFDADSLSAPSPIALPQSRGPARAPLAPVPAVLSSTSAALIVEPAPRRAAIVYGGAPGVEPLPPVALPPAERALPIAYGRPPTLLSTRGRDLLTRPLPAPGQPLVPPSRVAGLAMTPEALAALSSTPACEMDGRSVQLVPQPLEKSAIVAISAERTTVLTLPAKVNPTAKLGCGAGRIAIEAASPTGGEPTIASCALDGACVVAANAPFRPWLEPHERSMVAVPTQTGVTAVLTARAASRWGLYVAQSPDSGKIYELERALGEGTSDRGRIELGALLSFGTRVLMLLQADVTGTSRRGWYVMVSDDGGLTWNPP